MRQWLGEARGDLSVTIRTILRRPCLPVVIVLVLGLGIGGNVALFSVVDAILVRPLPYDNPERIVAISQTFKSRKDLTRFLPVELFHALRSSSTSFSSIAVYAPSRRSWSIDADRTLAVADVSPDFFKVLGVQPILGRTFTNQYERSEGLVSLLSFALWQTAFGADPEIIGKVISVNNKNLTIIGIMPKGFAFPNSNTQLWMPIIPPPRGFGYRTIARLLPDRTIEQARGEVLVTVAAVQPNIVTDILSTRVVRLDEEMNEEVRPALLLLFGSVVLILLLACASLANMLAARAQTRSKEYAIRMAVGAGRGSLIRTALTEGLTLSLTGAALGIVWAYFALPAILTLSPTKLQLERDIQVNSRVLLFAVAAAILTGIVIGLLPALQAVRTNPRDALTSPPRILQLTMSYRVGSAAFIIVQTAVGTCLLIGAGLLIRSYIALVSVDPGYDPVNVLTVRMPVLLGLTESLVQLPMVESVGWTDSLPLTTEKAYGTVTPEGWPPGMSLPYADFIVVNPGFFKSMRLRLKAGRFLTESDRQGAPPVVVVNESFVRQVFPSRNPVGKRVRLEAQYEIIGVVGDIKQYGLAKDVEPTLYFSHLQRSIRTRSYLTVRTHGRPEALISLLRREVESIDASLKLQDVLTMESRLYASTPFLWGVWEWARLS